MKNQLLYHVCYDQEQAKEGTEIKILTPNRILTRLLVLPSKIKVGNNLYELEAKPKIVYFINIKNYENTIQQFD